MTLSSPKKDEKSGLYQLDASALELLASRICHDLISPVGAVHNGVEFLQEMGASAGEEAAELIALSARQASARLQAFRLAYGAGGRDPNIKPEDVHKIFESLIIDDGKITQEWDPHAPVGFESYPLGYCKILMGVLMLAQECLPKGGTVSVQEGDRKNQTNIVATGENAGPRSMVVEALESKISPDAMDPRLIHPFVISLLANHYGFSITVTYSEPGSVTFNLQVI